MKSYQEIMDKINELHDEALAINVKDAPLEKQIPLIRKMEKLTAQANILVWVITNTKLSEI